METKDSQSCEPDIIALDSAERYSNSSTYNHLHLISEVSYLIPILGFQPFKGIKITKPMANMFKDITRELVEKSFVTFFQHGSYHVQTNTLQHVYVKFISSPLILEFFSRFYNLQPSTIPNMQILSL